MKTSKPFSTISYNTPDFLNQRLTDLVNRRKIDFFAWVFHYAEEDESKDHKHLYIVPNGRVDTDQVFDHLIEIDPSKPDNPLKCIRPKSSKFADWFLYAIHDVGYLAMKGQSRKYHYGLEDVQTSDNDYLLEEVHTIDFAKLNRFSALRDAAMNGVPFEELIMSGTVPIQQTFAYREAYNLMQRFRTERNGKKSHQHVNEDGELIVLEPLDDDDDVNGVF